MHAARIRKKKGIRLSGARNNFLFSGSSLQLLLLFLFLIIICDQENHGELIDYRRGTVSYDTTDLRRARGVRFSCSHYFAARHQSQTGSRSSHRG